MYKKFLNCNFSCIFKIIYVIRNYFTSNYKTIKNEKNMFP